MDKLKKKANRLWLQFKLWIWQRVERREWAEKKRNLLKDVPQKWKTAYDVLLENQHRYIMAERAFEPLLGDVTGSFCSMFSKKRRPSRLDLEGLAKRVLDGLAIKEWFGLQPMPSPLAYTYILQYVLDEKETEKEKERETWALKPWLGADQKPMKFNTAPHEPEIKESGLLQAVMPREKYNLEVKAFATESLPHKLEASFTIEAMQDMMVEHGFDIVDELMFAISTHIIQEIEESILEDVIEVSTKMPDFKDWSKDVKPRFFGDVMHLLGLEVNCAANEVAKLSRRGAANWIIASPMAVSILQSSPKIVFAPATTDEIPFKGPCHTMLVGHLNGSIKVYSSLNSKLGNKILVGYKGNNSECDAGLIFAPYVMLATTGVVVNPLTFQPVVKLNTRYGLKYAPNAPSYYVSFDAEILYDELGNARPALLNETNAEAA